MTFDLGALGSAAAIATLAVEAGHMEPSTSAGLGPCLRASG
jgi:hypothetical protein